jgi:formyltetrahydrofolate-dependent phosphoribosylglycinamide formyltransferase
MPHQPGETLRLGVLISGGGRTLLNLLEVVRRGELRAEVPLVIGSAETLKGVERARSAGLHVEIIRRRDHADIESFSGAIVDILERHGVDLAVLAGWLCLWRIPDRWMGRVMNIHPALLPKFGGKGFYGHHVHEAVLAAGEPESGCTVHFCNNEYDAGPIILQRTVPVMPGDDADTLAARVFEQECIAYPEAIRMYATGELHLVNGKVVYGR